MRVSEKKGYPNIIPEIVGTLLKGRQKKVPRIFGNSKYSYIKAFGTEDNIQGFWAILIRGVMCFLVVTIRTG